MSRRPNRLGYNPYLEGMYERAIKSANVSLAIDLGHHLQCSAAYTLNRIDRHRRQEREARRQAIASRYGVPVSWVRLEGETGSRYLPPKAPRTLRAKVLDGARVGFAFIAAIPRLWAGKR
jgi:hypothetical protein